MEEFSQIARLIPVTSELPFDEPYRGRYITHNPIGNQLISSGVVLVIPILNSLENLNSIPLQDWKAVMDSILSHGFVDSNSVFLVSTKEFAGPAFRLANQLEWEGLLLEEPEMAILGASLPDSSHDAVAMTELINAYRPVTGSIECPVLILRNEQNPIRKINDHALLNPMIKGGKKLYLSITSRPFRTLQTIGEDGERSPNFTSQQYAYDVEAVKQLEPRILHFIQRHGASPLRRLPQRSQNPWTPSRTQSLLSEIERIQQRGAAAPPIENEE